jgi:exosortase
LKRHIIFLAFTVAAAAMMYGPLRELLSSAARSDYYSHILLIPLVSAYLMFQDRKVILDHSEYSWRAGLIPLFAGCVLCVAGLLAGGRINQNDFTSFIVFSTLLFWAGAFILLYGTKSFKIALFPLLFLAFMIPIPTPLMDGFIYVLQVASTEVTNILFTIIGVPFTRQGFVFQLPGVSIEVAKQCSGIRSSLALVITVIVASHLFLNRGWTKTVLFLAVFPITVIKNGIRILTLTMLAVHVDERFLTGGFLHQSGGFLFYIPALGLLGLILWWLRRKERGVRSEE